MWPAAEMVGGIFTWIPETVPDVGYLSPKAVFIEGRARMDYEELAENARYTPKYQELYCRRKETIERVFALPDKKSVRQSAQCHFIRTSLNLLP